MRAREPDASGFVERDGVHVWWERFGAGDPAILFFHADPIVDVADVEGADPLVRPAPHRRGVRPTRQRAQRSTDDPAAYDDDEFIADAIDVLDVNRLERAVVVGVCQGAGVSS